MWRLPVIHGFWLGYLLMVTDALIDEADDWGGILLNSIG
jgi:hypothetical protein